MSRNKILSNLPGQGKDMALERTTQKLGQAMRMFALTVVLVLTGFIRADDPDPEPPGNAAQKLRGTWVSARRIVGGKEGPHRPEITFTFKGKKATYSYLKKKYALEFVEDKRRPGAFAVIGRSGKVPDKYFFKIVKGELHLTRQQGKDPKPDFQGHTMPVIIYKKQK